MPYTHSYAQTNLQLYAQLRRLGCSESSLGEVNRAYELAMRLFSGRYRANGKPFIAHLVGTASILAKHGAPSGLVAAGMLHATYLQGQFGDSQIGVTAERTRLLKAYASDETADLVAEYSRLPWNRKTLDKLRTDPARLSSCNPEVIFMRLANDLEDRLDLGMLYSAKKSVGITGTVPADFAPVHIANQLGHHALAAELVEVCVADAENSVPDVLITARRNSFTIETSGPGFASSLLNRTRILWRRRFG